jgi:anti-anti-sigma regulatory factor
MSGENAQAALHVTSTLRSGSEAMVVVAGPVDRDAVARLEPLLSGLCAAGATRVLVDLSRVSFCDRSLMPVFERVRCRVEEAGGWLVVDGSPATMSGYDDLPLDRIFRIYRDACGPRAAVPSTR